MLCALLMLATPRIGPPPKTALDNLSLPAPELPGLFLESFPDGSLDGSVPPAPAWPAPSPELSAASVAPAPPVPDPVCPDPVRPDAPEFGVPPSNIPLGAPGPEAPVAPPNGDAPGIEPPPMAAAPAMPSALVS